MTASINGINNPDKIYAGDTISIINPDLARVANQMQKSGIRGGYDVVEQLAPVKNCATSEIGSGLCK